MQPPQVCAARAQADRAPRLSASGGPLDRRRQPHRRGGPARRVSRPSNRARRRACASRRPQRQRGLHGAPRRPVAPSLHRREALRGGSRCPRRRDSALGRRRPLRAAPRERAGRAHLPRHRRHRRLASEPLRADAASRGVRLRVGRGSAVEQPGLPDVARARARIRRRLARRGPRLCRARRLVLPPLCDRRRRRVALHAPRGRRAEGQAELRRPRECGRRPAQPGLTTAVALALGHRSCRRRRRGRCL